MGREWFIIALFFSSVCSSKPRAPTVKFSTITVQGVGRKSRNGRDIDAFMGIPYAEPPIGYLRFRDPIPKVYSPGSLVANRTSITCIQNEERFYGDEDCLYLNVYRPKLERSKLLPVMVYFHGGRFNMGNVDVAISGPDYLLDKDVIMVSMTYRLGVLGFFSTGDEAATGNYGLKDQKLALQWIQRYIAAFGGNPDKVTLFGGSSGAACVHLLALVNHTEGLFHRYILQSGTALATWVVRDRKLCQIWAKTLATLTKCPSNSSSELVECLRRIDAARLVNTTRSQFTPLEHKYIQIWSPVKEPITPGAFLTDYPEDLIVRKKQMDLPFIVGLNTRDGLPLMDKPDLHNDTCDDEIIKFVHEEIDTYLGAPELSEPVVQFYFNRTNVRDDTQLFTDTERFFSDHAYAYPTFKMLEARRKASTKQFYLYRFEYRGTYSHTSKYVGHNSNLGAIHGDELIYLFSMNTSVFQSEDNETMTETDYRIVDTMVDLWTSFAIDGVPTSGIVTSWKPYGSQGHYLQIGKNKDPKTSLKSNFHVASVKFWDKYYKRPMQSKVRDPTVEVANITVQGVWTKTRNGRDVEAFMGIPYAEPPIGDFRFRDPVAKKYTKETIVANKTDISCAQYYRGVWGTEDCLYLNVYRPKWRGCKKLPVMVYIHGGGFVRGNADVSTTGPGFLLEKDIIFVTMTYRLGVFGFLTVGDEIAPGNFGLKDQKLALQWVNSNIADFGGDPERVTLFGGGSGSACVHIHALVNHTEGLFQRYILQSGTALAPWAFGDRANSISYAKRLATTNNCPAESSFKMIQCLRKIDTRRLYNTSATQFDKLEYMLLPLWAPIKEANFPGAYITEYPEDLIARNKQRQMPFMSGITEHESLSAVVIPIFVNDKSMVEVNKHVRRVLNISLGAADSLEPAVKFYFNGTLNSDNNTLFQQLDKFITDHAYVYPHIRMMREQENISKIPVYFYSLEYRGTFSFTSTDLGDNRNLGATHADEKIYLFDQDKTLFGLMDRLPMNENDYEVVDTFVELFTSFAKHGVPRSKKADSWTPWDSEGHYLQIGKNKDPKALIKSKFHTERMKFWDKYYGESGSEVSSAAIT